MSIRRPPARPTNRPAAQSSRFRQRYDAVEVRREQLIARLRALGAKAQSHPGYGRVLTLLNDTFRKSKLAQRLAVLESAAWLIDILERLGIGL